MTVFDFLNVKKIADEAFSPKRSKANKSAYRRLMELKRGQSPTIEKHELEAFYERYKKEDEYFRQYMDNLIKSKHLTK